MSTDSSIFLKASLPNLPTLIKGFRKKNRAIKKLYKDKNNENLRQSVKDYLHTKLILFLNYSIVAFKLWEIR